MSEEDLLRMEQQLITPQSSTNQTEQDDINIFTPKKPIEEMLGSVTTYNVLVTEGMDTSSSKNCQQVRTSARVFKKMKLDSALASTVPPDKKESSDNKSEVVKKPLRPLWSSDDKDYFFEALNEYGKDFDAIQTHVNGKLKKKGQPDSLLKTKDQIRHFYYRTWHKISKYLKFSEDVKKIAQELYALINYGELRKKIGAVSGKIGIKLNELIYRGTVTIRVKGKSIRVKTPMCRALRKLNQLDEKQEDVKLPTRIWVELRPKNMETWLNIQFMGQNPRVRLIITLQKRFSTVLNSINERWKSHLSKAHEELHKLLPESSSSEQCSSPQIRVFPKNCASIQIPTINLSEYITSHRICLNAYEERIGVRIPGEQFFIFPRQPQKRFTGKRQRLESAGESGSSFKTKSDKGNECSETEITPQADVNPLMDVGDVIDNAINTILLLQNRDEGDNEKDDGKCSSDDGDKTETCSREEQIERIKRGWTADECGTMTIGELYLMFGQNSKLELEYTWSVGTKTVEESSSSTELSRSLKYLVSLAKLHYRKQPRNRCTCGHVCTNISNYRVANQNKSNIITVNNNNVTNVNVSSFASTTANNAGAANVFTPQQQKLQVQKEDTSKKSIQMEPVLFRKPNMSFSSNTSANCDSFKAQLNSLQQMRPKCTNRKGRPVRSKQVIVERMLPLLPKPVVNGHALVTMKMISPSETQRTNHLRPIAPKLSEDAKKQLVVEEVKNDSVMNNKLENVNSEKDINIIDVNKKSSLLLQTTERLTSFAGLLTEVETDLESEEHEEDRDDTAMQLLKDDDDQQWLNAEVNDYSLTSLLRQLESPIKNDSVVQMTHDMDSQFPCLLGENGVDFVDQFVDLAAQVHVSNIMDDDTPSSTTSFI